MHCQAHHSRSHGARLVPTTVNTACCVLCVPPWCRHAAILEYLEGQGGKFVKSAAAFREEAGITTTDTPAAAAVDGAFQARAFSSPGPLLCAHGLRIPVLTWFGSRTSAAP